MAKTKSAALTLVESTGKAPQRIPRPAEPDFIRKLLAYEDVEAAARLVTEQAARLWDAKHGDERTRAQELLADLNPRYKRSTEELAKLEKRQADTPQFVRAPHAQTGEDVHKVPFSDWHTKDKILIILIVLFALLALALGAGNVFANLMSSGNPVFLEDPWLAMGLSALLPIGSVAVKFATNFMAFDASRRLYAQFIFALTLAVLLTWTVLFAINFDGVGASISFDSLLEPKTNTNTALVWTQLAAEMLAGSALFLAAEHIYVKYAPDYYTQNIDYIEVKRACDEHKKAHDELSNKRAELFGRERRLGDEREAEINEQVASFIYLRGRYRAASDFS